VSHSEELRLSPISPYLSLLIHAAFFFTGMVTTLLGPILPVLAQEWRLSDGQAGYLFTSQFLGSLIGVVVSGEITVRRGYSFTFASGLFLMAIGVAALGFGSWLTALGSAACYGIGLGLVIPTVNLLVAQAGQGRKAARLSILNLFWALGAVAWPWIAALGGGIHTTRPLLVLLAASLATAAVLFTIGAFPSPPQSLENSRSAAPQAGRDRSTLQALALGASFFLYVGVETSLTGWAPTHAMRLPGMSTATAVLMPSFFWVAVILGRTTAPFSLRYVSERALLVASLGTATLGSCVFLLSNQLAGVVAGLGLAGLGLAAVFPCLVSNLSDLFGARATRVGGIFFALAGLGGATLPWAVGMASIQLHSLRAALALTLVAQLCLFVLPAVDRSRSSKLHEAAS
jgi:MFS transporter, FHS family, glucose/mannose:H+ symporter